MTCIVSYLVSVCLLSDVNNSIEAFIIFEKLEGLLFKLICKIIKPIHEIHVCRPGWSEEMSGLCLQVFLSLKQEKFIQCLRSLMNQWKQHHDFRLSLYSDKSVKCVKGNYLFHFELLNHVGLGTAAWGAQLCCCSDSWPTGGGSAHQRRCPTTKEPAKKNMTLDSGAVVNGNGTWRFPPYFDSLIHEWRRNRTRNLNFKKVSTCLSLFRWIGDVGSSWERVNGKMLA